MKQGIRGIRHLVTKTNLTSFGYEGMLSNSKVSTFVHAFACWLIVLSTVEPIWWKLNHGQTKIRPVRVIDVARALNNLIQLPALAQTLNLPGPSTVTCEYLLITPITYNPPTRAHRSQNCRFSSVKGFAGYFVVDSFSG